MKISLLISIACLLFASSWARSQPNAVDGTSLPLTLPALARPAEPASACQPLCNDCAPCAPSPIWIGAEYLLWWVKKGPLPVPLVTSGNPALDFAGALGQPGTAVLAGNSSINFGAFSGSRIRAGFWFDPEQTIGFEASAFLLENRQVSPTIGSGGNPALFLPLRDVTFGEDSFTVAFPGALAGKVTIASASQLWGAEANLVGVGIRDGVRQISFLAGFRQLNLQESVTISRSVNDFGGLLADPTNPGNPEPAGSLLATTDRFDASNHFYGGQLGMRWDRYLDRGFFVTFTGKLALGSTHQIVDISGATVQQKPGQPATTLPVGIFAGSATSGHFNQDVFSVLPDVEIKLGRDILLGNGWMLRPFAGYNFLYWTHVVRPGDQINRNVDERAIPTAVSFTPGFHVPLGPPSFTQSGFWAQGLTLGCELQF